MKYIIIGATSFIGSNIYSYCRQKKLFAIGTTRKCIANTELYQYELGKDRIENILDLKKLGISGTCAIICSAITNIDWCYLHKEESNIVNVTATIELIKTLNFYGIKCIFLSSEAVFDGKHGYYSEEDTVNPITVYGEQKVAVEHFILGSVKENNTIVRISRAISDKKCVNDYRNDLLYSFWQNGIKNEPILCIKNQSFTPTYVMDIVKSILKCAEENLGGIYHISNTEILTRAELATKFCNYYNIRCEIKELLAEEIGCKDNRHIFAGLNSKKFKEETKMNYIQVDNIIKEFR